MSRLPVRSAMLLAATCAAWQPSKARAGDEDTQFWLIANATGEIAKDTRLIIDSSQRWREDARGGDQQSLRITLDHEVADGVRVGGGFAVFEAGGITELRPHQQIIITRGRIESRTRLEQRFFDRADRMELRLRQRLTYTLPVAEGWRATAGIEWLGIMQSRTRGEGAATEQWRFQTGLVHQIDKNLDLGAGYWLVVFPRGSRPDRISHVPQAVILYRF